jgi:amino acid adenylation domain-containing protein
VDNGRQLSYAQLAGRAAAVARRLGPRPGVVGVAATHCADTVAAMLGVWSAGGAYCPVDPAFPEPRRRTMLAAAGCRYTLDPRTGSLSPHANADNDPDGLAYTLFTSGSTGEPRPVLTPDRAIGTVTAALRELFGLTPDDRVLQFAALNWDTCFEEILPTLTAGACLVFHPDAHTGSFHRFLRMVDRERITVLDLPTAFWHELVTHLVDERAPLPGCVRLVVIGGEAASPARLADWRGLATGHARLLNTYGCTETTLITHAIDLHGPATAADEAAAARVPIGWALPHVVEHISEAGELLIGGPSLAEAYRGQPEQTRQRFVTVNGQRFFRTGDRVSRRPDGALVHEGRLDGEIKIRGIRVDPAEVEAHIAGHPAVSAVAVTGLRVADHTVLAAFVVARPHAATAGLAANILDYLRGRIPAHLIPTRIRVVTDLVYTASGKVDRHRIKEALA